MIDAIDASWLRLALFTDTALPQLNGVARTLDRLVHAVRARGGVVRTFTTSEPDVPSDVSIRRYPSMPFWAYPQLRVAMPGATTVTRDLAAFGPTLVHVATPFGVGLAGRAAALRLGIPLVSSYHTSLSAYASYYGLGMLAAPGWRFLRWFHNSGRHTYCPTRAVQDELRQHDFARTRIWGRGVDTTRFAPRHRSASFRSARLGADANTIVVAYVGRLAAEKGLDVAIDAMRVAREQSRARIVCAFAGDGPYAETCRARAPEGSIFLGRLDGDELSRFYASADLFVFPSTTDTFGNVLVEAMASGLPIVAADAAPTRELLRDGACGEIVSGRRAMADAIVRLAIDDARRAELAARGLAVASQQSWDAVFDGLLEDYRQAAHGDERYLLRGARAA